jgi:hypothetical protein
LAACSCVACAAMSASPSTAASSMGAATGRVPKDPSTHPACRQSARGDGSRRFNSVSGAEWLP